MSVIRTQTVLNKNWKNEKILNSTLAFQKNINLFQHKVMK